MQRLFKYGLIIDGLGGATEHGWVLTEGAKIVSVAKPNEPIPELPGDTEIVDLSNKSLMPGLIDAHVHLTFDGSPDLRPQVEKPLVQQGLLGAKHALQSLRAGITTVRDLGARAGVNLQIRDAIDSGIIPGSKVVAAGEMICMTGGHGWFLGRECDGPNQVRRAVRQEIKAGADCIKLMATGGILTEGVDPSSAQFTYAEMRAGIEAAHNAGLKTATHAQGAPGIANAVKAGIDSVEHGYFLTDELIEIMLEKGIYLVPTISSITAIIDNQKGKGIPEWAVEKTKVVIDEAQKNNATARRSGVLFAMGTDAGTPFNLHGNNGDELSAMVNWDFSPMEAIVAATGNAAKLLGIDEYLGSIESGKTADLLVVRGNPLQDIGLLAPNQGIESVYQAGKLVSINEI
jgi:imidazolonepropionase-like amidohydrolase